MNPKARAVLLNLKALTKQDKPDTKCKPYTKTAETRVLVALPDAGRDDWARFKRECVLLKGGK